VLRRVLGEKNTTNFSKGLPDNQSESESSGEGIFSPAKGDPRVS
jgi:hypothetical protein